MIITLTFPQCLLCAKNTENKYFDIVTNISSLRTYIYLLGQCWPLGTLCANQIKHHRLHHSKSIQSRDLLISIEQMDEWLKKLAFHWVSMIIIPFTSFYYLICSNFSTILLCHSMFKFIANRKNLYTISENKMHQLDEYIFN